MIPYAAEAVKPVEDILKEEYDYEESRNIKWYDRVILDRPSKVILGLILFSILLPILLYQFVLFGSLDLPPPDGYSFGSCLLSRESRLLCGNGSSLTEHCHPNCCFDAGNHICYHRFPSRFSYILSRDWEEDMDLQPRVAQVPFKGRSSLHNLRISIDEVSETHMSITYYDPNKVILNGRRVENKRYSYEFSTPELDIEVKENDRILFNTMRGPLVAADDIWEVVFKLTNESMFGLGEIPLVENTRKVLYAHNMEQSLIPLIFAEFNGTYHGLLIDTVAPTEVTISSQNHVVIRSITKLGIKLHIFVGPEPQHIMEDVQKFIGYQNRLQYWMLGAHVCSQLSEMPEESLEDLNKFLITTENNLPFESHCGTFPIVFQNDCNTRIVEFIEKGVELISKSKKRFVPHVSPHVEINNETFVICGENTTDFFIKNEDGSDVYTGSINSTAVLYPDYKNTTYELLETLWRYKGEIHGISLQNNWPLDESETHWYDIYRNLPYFNDKFEDAFRYTPAWDSKLASGNLYIYEHNEYGNNFASAMKNFIGKDIPVWSTSQRLNGDVVPNSQNVDASWSNLHKELVTSALSGVSGIWLWSSPICGDTEYFNRHTQVNLCVKWYQAATYLPMININSKSVARYPSAFNGTEEALMLSALKNRLSFLPYFNTVLQKGPLLRPMFYQYPKQSNLKNIKTQFNVGDDLLIVPNLQPEQNFVHAWLPPGTWYEFRSGFKINSVEGEAVTMSSTDADLLTFVRAGSIVPTQKDVKLTAEKTRLLSGFLLTIALKYDYATDTYSAEGNIHLSSELAIKFIADDRRITISKEGKDFSVLCGPTSIWAHEISELYIYGLRQEFNSNDDHLHIMSHIWLCPSPVNKTIIYEFY